MSGCAARTERSVPRIGARPVWYVYFNTARFAVSKISCARARSVRAMAAFLTRRGIGRVGFKRKTRTIDFSTGRATVSCQLSDYLQFARIYET